MTDRLADVLDKLDADACSDGVPVDWAEWLEAELVKVQADMGAKDETIKARERSITELRYRVRELEKRAETAEGRRVYYDDLSTWWYERARRMQRERDEWKAKAERMERAQEITHRALEAEIDRTDTHYCCMHQRWETREGAEV